MDYTTQQFQAGQVLRASQLNAMDAAIKTSMKSTLPITVHCGKVYTAMLGQKLIVNVEGDLEPGGSYALQLFRYSKSSQRWVMMWDNELNCSNFGWARLAGGTRTSHNGVKTSFTQDIPAWMPNNGLLQSRFFFSPGNDTSSYTISFFTKTWILDALKPLESTDWNNVARYGLIGVERGKYASLKLKAGILHFQPDNTYQLVGLSDSVIHVYYPGKQGLWADSVLEKGAAKIGIRIIH